MTVNPYDPPAESTKKPPSSATNEPVTEKPGLKDFGMAIFLSVCVFAAMMVLPIIIIVLANFIPELYGPLRSS